MSKPLIAVLNMGQQPRQPLLRILINDVRVAPGRRVVRSRETTLSRFAAGPLANVSSKSVEFDTYSRVNDLLGLTRPAPQRSRHMDQAEENHSQQFFPTPF